MIQRLLLFYLIFTIKICTARRRCVNNGVLFNEKIIRSPIVVYGEVVGKRVYLDSDTELLFNVSFRVDCILKGPDIQSPIEITDAGIKSGHTACQWLDPGYLYVVFLEKWGVHANGYRPLDFQERLVDDVTTDELQKTCGLMKIPPLYSATDRCPQVSNSTYCPLDAYDRSVAPEEQPAQNRNPQVKQSYFDHGSLFQLQSNITVPREGSLMAFSGGLHNNHACSPTISGVLFFIIPLIMINIF
ncbi:unnamed protein product [Adineta ricciae]|uniref:Uncharacterized protein n=1 Tax=Adineta ricciae TaxID=249248 RepID=A0A814AI93_ADIRI|nr:unnamed protein product [Adineta ricciae]CAF0912943.1 unnamed protein product [Adineta ricciae]